jgi:hypothetical protein
VLRIKQTLPTELCKINDLGSRRKGLAAYHTT